MDTPRVFWLELLEKLSSLPFVVALVLQLLPLKSASSTSRTSVIEWLSKKTLLSSCTTEIKVASSLTDSRYGIFTKEHC